MLSFTQFNESAETVLKDVEHDIRRRNKSDTDELLDRKIINKMKSKRNSKSGMIKKKYQILIDKLESDFNKNYKR